MYVSIFEVSIDANVRVEAAQTQPTDIYLKHLDQSTKYTGAKKTKKQKNTILVRCRDAALPQDVVGMLQLVPYCFVLLLIMRTGRGRGRGVGGGRTARRLSHFDGGTNTWNMPPFASR